MSDNLTSTTDRTAIGIDYRDDLYYVARIQHHAGRSEVKVLARFERMHVRGHQLLEEGSFVFSVPDDKVIARNINIANCRGFDSDLLARFELAQSLIDDEREFCFDVIPTNRQGRFLGLTVRRSILGELSEPFYNGSTDSPIQAAYKIRSAALGRGYIDFCQRETGEFICL
ncbi:MAG: hypothetical protein U9R56_00960, partial [candidate division Zixibacteria bacterium]|nr:hypothetical protein [candidate division Zixibacteria bacterium]